MSDFNNLSIKEWEQIEREEHNNIYKDSFPFDFKSYKIDHKHVIWWEDYCYKPGRRKDRGHRTKLVFELMNLETLKNKVILEVGCGNGQYAVFFALMGAKVYAFDISPIGITVGKRIAKVNCVSERTHFSVQNASNMNYPDNFFDIVIFHEVFHHAIKYPNVREETFRVVKKGGMVICAETLSGNVFFKLGRFFTMRGKEAKGDIQITLSDLKDFAKGFSEYNIELMSLFFMSKRIFLNYLRFPAVRWFLFSMKRLDDFVFWAFPYLKKYCGECILILKK